MRLKWVNVPAETTGMTTESSRSTRRNVLLASAAALTGFTAVRAGVADAAGTPKGTAAATPGTTPSTTPTLQSPLLMGRSNDAQTGATWLYTKVSGIALGVVQKGSGVAAQFLSEAANGAAGLTRAKSRWGLHGANLATSTSTGGAVRAEGGANIGLFADTAPGSRAVPAIVAIGADGTGTAQVARGTSYLDGDACLLRPWVGVATRTQRLAYAPLASGEKPQHWASGRVTLSTKGSATVTLPEGFRAACDLGTLVVTLTPVGASMPNLYVTHTATGFTVAKGTAKGVVAWSASAVRTAMDLSPTSSTSTQTVLAGATAGERSAASALRDAAGESVRFSRTETAWPDR